MATTPHSDTAELNHVRTRDVYNRRKQRMLDNLQKQVSAPKAGLSNWALKNLGFFLDFKNLKISKSPNFRF